MRILIVTNLYPPYFFGGYELRCAQVAEALQLSGHDVCVLTSAYGFHLSPLGKIRPCTEDLNGVPVHRVLNQYVYPPQPVHRPWTVFQAKRELSDVNEFVELVKSFQPDVINWWSMYGLSKSLLPLPPVWGIPDVHWIEHWWMIREYGPTGEHPSAFWAKLWDGEWGPQGLRSLLRLAGREWERRTARKGIPTREFKNSPRHVCFVSQYMRELHRAAGFEFPSSEIIYGGVPRKVFYEPIDTRRYKAERLRLLYAGQITQDRALHTVIEALGRLDPLVRSRLNFSVAGGNGPPDYLEHIMTKVAQLHLGDCVKFLGKIAHEEMPRIYKCSDVLVFPSIRDEGLPLTMVEAMLAGCAVITTGSGGAMEVANLAGLPLFPKEDSRALTELLTRLVCGRAWVREIATHGQQVALQEFTSDRMVQKIEAMLLRITEQQQPGRAAASGNGLAVQVSP